MGVVDLRPARQDLGLRGADHVLRRRGREADRVEVDRGRARRLRPRDHRGRPGQPERRDRDVGVEVGRDLRPGRVGAGPGRGEGEGRRTAATAAMRITRVIFVPPRDPEIRMPATSNPKRILRTCVESAERSALASAHEPAARRQVLPRRSRRALRHWSAAASAGAAAWQGPRDDLGADRQCGRAARRSRSGAPGDAVAAWWDDSSGGRIALARKRAGAAWSAPVTVAAPVGATPLFPAVDGSGNITVAYTSGGATTIATWAAAARRADARAAPGPRAHDRRIRGRRLPATPCSPASPEAPRSSPSPTGRARRERSPCAPTRTSRSATPSRPRARDQRRRARRPWSSAPARLRAITRTAAADWPAAPEKVDARSRPCRTRSRASASTPPGTSTRPSRHTLAGRDGAAHGAAARRRRWQQSGDLSSATAMRVGVVGRPARRARRARRPWSGCRRRRRRRA